MGVAVERRCRTRRSDVEVGVHRYTPHGYRSFGPSIANGKYCGTTDFVKTTKPQVTARFWPNQNPAPAWDLTHAKSVASEGLTR